MQQLNSWWILSTTCRFGNAKRLWQTMGNSSFKLNYLSFGDTQPRKTKSIRRVCATHAVRGKLWS